MFFLICLGLLLFNREHFYGLLALVVIRIVGAIHIQVAIFGAILLLLIYY